MAHAVRHRATRPGAARGAPGRSELGARLSPVPIRRPAAALPPTHDARSRGRTIATSGRAVAATASRDDVAADAGAVAALAARVADLPPSKRRDKALKKVSKAVKALERALEDDESSGSESDGEPLAAATPMTAASARALAFSLAGAARRSVGEPAPPRAPGEAAVPSPVLAAVAGALSLPDPPAVDPAPAPRLEVCTGPRCARLGSAALAAALEHDYEGGVAPCSCTGECGGAVDGEAWFEAKWDVADEAEGDALERRLANLV